METSYYEGIFRAQEEQISYLARLLDRLREEYEARLEEKEAEIARLREALESVIYDMRLRAGIRGDVENGVAVLDISDGVLEQVRAAVEADRKTHHPIGEETIQQLHDVLLYLQNETMKLEAAYGRNFKKGATEKARVATEKMEEAVYAIKNADRKRRGEPVARATVYELDGRRQVLIVELGTEAAAALVDGVYDLYTAPQPAEPVKVPSDEELEKAWDSFEAEMARHPTDDELEEFMGQFADEQGNIRDDQHGEAARSLLARYGSKS